MIRVFDGYAFQSKPRECYWEQKENIGASRQWYRKTKCVCQAGDVSAASLVCCVCYWDADRSRTTVAALEFNLGTVGGPFGPTFLKMVGWGWDNDSVIRGEDRDR